METINFLEDLEDLSSAEDFLNYFDIEFDQSVVHINRLHIMQRYHDYLTKAETNLSESPSEQATYDIYKLLLSNAYQDFVTSDAKTEKVLKVYKMQEPQTTFVSVDDLLG